MQNLMGKPGKHRLGFKVGEPAVHSDVHEHSVSRPSWHTPLVQKASKSTQKQKSKAQCSLLAVCLRMTYALLMLLVVGPYTRPSRERIRCWSPPGIRTLKFRPSNGTNDAIEQSWATTARHPPPLCGVGGTSAPIPSW